jgi:hypothetical protein
VAAVTTQLENDVKNEVKNEVKKEVKNEIGNKSQNLTLESSPKTKMIEEAALGANSEL